MQINCALLISGFVISSCNNSYDLVTYAVSKKFPKPVIETISFNEKDDTSAFMQACRLYWGEKIAVTQMNKIKGDDSPIPYKFILRNKAGTILSFSKEMEENYSTRYVKYYNEMFLLPKDARIPKRMGEKD